MNMRRKLVAIPIAACLFVSGSSGLAANASEDEDNRVDSLSTTERWAEQYEVYRSDSSVIVDKVDSELGEILVTYTDDVTPVSHLANVDPETNEVEVSGSYMTEIDVGIAGYASSGSAWVNYSNACQTREQNNTGWVDGCYKIHKETADNDPNYDYYTWTQSATGKSKGTWSLTRVTGTSKRSASSQGAWSWVDWSPKSDSTVSGCRSITLSVSHVFGISSSLDQCGSWQLSKGTAAGTFGNNWKGLGILTNSAREVGHMTIIKTPTGKKPVWTFDHGFFAV